MHGPVCVCVAQTANFVFSIAEFLGVELGHDDEAGDVALHVANEHTLAGGGADLDGTRI